MTQTRPDLTAIRERCSAVPGFHDSQETAAYGETLLADLQILLPDVEAQVSATFTGTGASVAGRRVLERLQRMLADWGPAERAGVWDVEEIALAGRLALRVIEDGDRMETYCYRCHEFKTDTRLVRGEGGSAYACPACRRAHGLLLAVPAQGRAGIP